MEETNSNKHKFQKVPNEQRDVLLKYHNWDHRHRLLKLERLFIQIQILTNTNIIYNKCKNKLFQVKILLNEKSYKIPNDCWNIIIEIIVIVCWNWKDYLWRRFLWTSLPATGELIVQRTIKTWIMAQSVPFKVMSELNSN